MWYLSNADKEAWTTAVSNLPHTDQNRPCLVPPQSSRGTQVLPGEGHKVADKIQKMTGTFPAAQLEISKATPPVPGLAVHLELLVILLSRIISVLHPCVFLHHFSSLSTSHPNIFTYIYRQRLSP